MIIDLHKYLIFGTKQDLDVFFVLAQRAGFLEFIGPSRKKVELPQIAKTFLNAIKIAKHYPIHPNEAPVGIASSEDLANQMVSMKSHQETLLETERLLVSEIARISVFGDFSRSELDAFEIEARRVVQFFCMKSYLSSRMTLPSDLIYVGTDYDLDYFVVVNRERIQYPKMIEIQIEHPVGELREKLQSVREEIAKLETDLRIFSNGLHYLQEGLVKHLNEYSLKLAKQSASLPLGDAVFATEAWVPSNHIQSLQGLVSGLNVDVVRIAVGKKETVPTYMENIGFSKVGEDILHIFDTPSHEDKDPSLWILVFFSLFFSMIVCDAGYGCVFLLIMLFLKWKFPRARGVKRRFLKLGMILSVSSIFWGCLTSSYFAIDFSPDNPLQKTSIIAYLAKKKADYHFTLKDDVYQEYVKKYPSLSTENADAFIMQTQTHAQGHVTYPIFDEFSTNVLMEFSFLAGILHISLSFLRYLRRNWAGLGWVIFMVGGYLYFPSIVQATVLVNFMGWISKPVAYAVGFDMVFAGIALAFLAALWKKRWGAFSELFHIVQVFADVLSYLRLYALALGGMVMARTFNDSLGIEMGLIGTIVIVLAGHLININVSLMGAVVHGLRLNFLEWFHYSFEGGGRLFNPLALKRFEKS